MPGKQGACANPTKNAVKPPGILIKLALFNKGRSPLKDMSAMDERQLQQRFHQISSNFSALEHSITEYCPRTDIVSGGREWAVVHVAA
jgi:hypothetical protein